MQKLAPKKLTNLQEWSIVAVIVFIAIGLHYASKRYVLSSFIIIIHCITVGDLFFTHSAIEKEKGISNRKKAKAKKKKYNPAPFMPRWLQGMKRD